MIVASQDTEPLAHGERLVVAALAAGQWRTSAELVDETGLLAPAVRVALRQLRATGRVERSLEGHWRAVPASVGDSGAAEGSGR